MKLSEIRLVAAWLAEKALDALLPASDPQVRAAEKRSEEDFAEPLGEYIDPELFTPDVPAGVEPDPPVSPGSTGGHPYTTSELLTRAAGTLRTCYFVLARDDIDRPLMETHILTLLPQLQDRAKAFAATGD